MYKSMILAALLAYAEARFGQEQVPVAAISALSNFGQPGQAATLAGSVPGSLLAAANPCQKLSLADQIVSTLGNDQAVISAAAGLVAAEQNFNPFAVSIPNICADASLPATEVLRGIVPLVDPAVTGSDVENANSAQSVQTPFNANGLSVADVMAAQGFSNFTAVNGNGAGAQAGGGGNNAGANNGNAGSNNGNAGANNGNASSGASGKCGGGGAASGASGASNSSAGANAGSGAQAGSGGNQASNVQASAGTNSSAATGGQTDLAGVDFGKCTPTMDFQFGRAGRKADEGTFLPTDALVAQGQQDALNPNIITNRICDQLVNVCDANQAALDACASAKSLVQGLGTKDATTADAFNQALGF